ncbi:MAG: CHAP domain-containing protein [Acidimicrobiales bacterium]
MFPVLTHRGAGVGASPRGKASQALVEGRAGPRISPLRKRIVAVAESQLGYRTDPPSTYCNKFSSFWSSGAADCGNSNRDEEWCADFAAWVWQEAGAQVVYQYINGDLNSSAASFYEWGLRTGTWHPLGSGYVPQPGDVAVYGLGASALVAEHVAIVVSYTPGALGPRAVNGDSDRTGFSVVELGHDEYQATASGTPSLLSGYTSPMLRSAGHTPRVRSGMSRAAGAY